MPDRVNGSDHEPFLSLCDESPERAMMPPPQKSRGAVWAWVAIGVLVALYVWKHWPK